VGGVKVAADAASATTSVIGAVLGVTGLAVIGTAAAASAAGAGSSAATAGGGAAAATALLGQAQFIATAGRVGGGKGTQTAGTQALSEGLDWTNGHLIQFDVASICPAMEGIPQELLGTVSPDPPGTSVSSLGFRI